MSDFSYQKHTATASHCWLYWDPAAEPGEDGAWQLPALSPLCRNTKTCRTMRHPSNVCPAGIKTRWKHCNCWMLCEGGGCEWETCPGLCVQTGPSGYCMAKIAQITSTSPGQSSCAHCGCLSLSHWAWLLWNPISHSSGKQGRLPQGTNFMPFHQ